MCPFAHTLTSENSFNVLLPQKHLIDSYSKQTVFSHSPSHFFKDTQLETHPLHCTALITSMILHHGVPLNHSLISTSRLIL